MAGERVKLMVQNRAVLGSAESRRLRRQGLIPGVLYGREQPVSISITERDLRSALTTKGGLNAVLDVVVEGGKVHSSVLKEFQQDKVRGHITHIDLQEVRLDQPIHATVPLHLHGEAVGVKEGGVLSQVTSEINVEALRSRAPDSESLRRYDTIARLLTGQPHSNADDAVWWLTELCARLQIPPLSAYGVEDSHIPELVSKAAKASSMKANPIELTTDELTEIVTRARTAA